MAERELQQLRQVLRDAVKATRMPVRDLEQALGIGSGALARLLEGTMEIRVRHLLRFAELLKVPPEDFFALAFPDALRQAEYRLIDWLSPPQRAKSAREALASRDDLVELVRAAVREEMASLAEKPDPS